jgi:hypothetical protein
MPIALDAISLVSLIVRIPGCPTRSRYL